MRERERKKKKKKSGFFPTIFQPNQLLSLDYCVTFAQLLSPADLLPERSVGSATLWKQSLFTTALCPLSLPQKIKSHFSGGIEGRGRSTGLPGAQTWQPAGQLLPSRACSSVHCFPFPPQDAAVGPTLLFAYFDKICIWDFNSFH